MIRKLTYHLLAVAFLSMGSGFLTPDQAHGQFIDLQLDIDSELTATTEKPLEFGTLTTNSGRRMIELGSVNMGIFSITGLEQQMLLVTLNKPNALRHDNPAVKEIIPLELFARYGYSAQNYQDSIPLPEASSSIKMESNPEPGPWNTIYIFMYGAVDIGDVPDGSYANQIVLSVEYI